MLSVGIDPSLANTAVCLLNPDGTVRAGFNYKHSKAFHLPKKTPGYEWLRLGQVRQFVTESIGLNRQGAEEVVIGYEAYSYDSINLPYTTGELGGVLKLALSQLGHFPYLVEPTVLKKFATGVGFATKEEMIEQAVAESDWVRALSKKDRTDDICDAYFLAKYVWYKTVSTLAVKHETCRERLRERIEYTQPATPGRRIRR
jgi:Holliday junction resolvasome RuvABC endonuclease subunit